nr:MAG TPA: hypothetical protein [Caudoviricetes sp.]
MFRTSTFKYHGFLTDKPFFNTCEAAFIAKIRNYLKLCI